MKSCQLFFRKYFFTFIIKINDNLWNTYSDLFLDCCFWWKTKYDSLVFNFIIFRHNLFDKLLFSDRRTLDTGFVLNKNINIPWEIVITVLHPSGIMTNDRCACMHRNYIFTAIYFILSEDDLQGIMFIPLTQNSAPPPSTIIAFDFWIYSSYSKTFCLIFQTLNFWCPYHMSRLHHTSN